MDQLGDGADMDMSIVLNNSMVLTTASDVKVVAHTDYEVIKQLKEIENNHKSVLVNANVVQDLSSMFTQELILRFFAVGTHTVLM
jgi:hypothetical protein